MPGQFQEDVLERRDDGAKVGDVNPMLGETLNHAGHEVVSHAVNRAAPVLARHVEDARDRSKPFGGAFVAGGHR